MVRSIRVKIHSIPNGEELKRYIVCAIVAGEFFYLTSCDNRIEALNHCKEKTVSGRIVFDRENLI